MDLIPKYRVVIIGNGFDISQGLKTSYTDFMLDYFKTVYITAAKTGRYEDKLLNLDLEATGRSYSGSVGLIEKCTDLKVLHGDGFKGIHTKIAYNGLSGSFFHNLITQHLKESKWIDIEKFYYKTLRTFAVKSNNMDAVISLNVMMDTISDMLEDYLGREQFEFYKDNSVSFESIKPYLSNVHQVDESSGFINTNKLEKVLLLNFNYTNIVGAMIHGAAANGINVEEINIHGEIGNPDNPIIFGYGDDTSDDYHKLEVADEDEFLINIKSFRYPRTDSYHKVLDFIDSGDVFDGENDFDVVIAGHSCGLSDKTLLKTIFEHQSCIAITAFHFKTDEKEAIEEHFYKGIAISRHFNDKPSFREKFQSFDTKAKIIQKKRVIVEEVPKV